GLGFGLTLMGAFRAVTGLASPERRAEVTAAAYVVIYLALGVPAVLAGLGVTYLGLLPTTLVYSAVVAVLAVLAGTGALMHLGDGRNTSASA
ncbi:MAG: hypothetical protein J2P19_17130, partial [Pseudonocardia sp.]|nr:hypothetical protein [Pseudonocardia sp.]